jgi:Concanavalin A-like lectin/glucanases superfamily
MAGIDSQTVLCLHADGTDTSTTFTDSSQYTHTVTANGNAQIDTAFQQFGSGSALFDGTGDYLTTPDSADWAFGAGAFTFDWWVRFNSTSGNQGFFGQWAGVGTTSFQLRLDGGTQLSFYPSTDGSTFSTLQFAWTPSTNTWYHVALTRDGSNNVRAFVGGTQIGTTQTYSGTMFDSSAQLTIGTGTVAGGEYVNGWMDEIRISKGVARWTANFTPPTSAYSVTVTSTKAGYATAGGVATGARTGGTPAAPAYPYVDLVPSYDLDNVFNRWTVTRDQGSPQMAEDTTSQAKYFLRAKQTQTLVSDDAAALAQAARKIAKFKDPQNRIETVTIQPLTDLTNTGQIAAGLGRDIGHVITIKETPPGFAAAQTKNYVIQSISGQINAGPMTTMTLTFGVWPA